MIEISLLTTKFTEVAQSTRVFRNKHKGMKRGGSSSDTIRMKSLAERLV
ncbi:MAG: hypothetical protein JNM41_10295 [Flavipsychrobacter sp.]|nr:hypothetical protein [Flavipsychrobacter sp.]